MGFPRLMAAGTAPGLWSSDSVFDICVNNDKVRGPPPKERMRSTYTLGTFS